MGRSFTAEFEVPFPRDQVWANLVESLAAARFEETKADHRAGVMQAKKYLRDVATIGVPSLENGSQHLPKTFGEKVTIRLTGHGDRTAVVITSRAVFGLFARGENRKNVELISSELRRRLG